MMYKDAVIRYPAACMQIQAPADLLQAPAIQPYDDILQIDAFDPANHHLALEKGPITPKLLQTYDSRRVSSFHDCMKSFRHTVRLAPLLLRRNGPQLCFEGL
jgi:hypothetical protein